MKKSRFLLLLLALMVSMAASAQGILGTVVGKATLTMVPSPILMVSSR